MAIELSTITFTEQDDIVPVSGVEEISNTSLANTLAGDDIITGTGKFITSLPFEVFSGPYYYSYTIKNYSGLSNAYATLNTATGNDRITGIVKNSENFFEEDSHSGITNSFGTINTEDGDDTITGIIQNPTSHFGPSGGIYNHYATINTGDGNDIITGTAEPIITDSNQVRAAGIRSEYSTIDTGDGNDTITGTGLEGLSAGIDLNSGGTFNTGKGDDIITGIGAILNLMVTFNTGEGNDTIIGSAKNLIYGAAIYNSGSMDTGDGNDIINGTNIINDNIIGSTGYGIFNEQGSIDTGDGNDIITGLSDIGCYNGGSINTGNGEDSIIFQGGLNNEGEVFLGDGNDSISVDPDYSDVALENFQMIDTGNGNDIITSTGVIYNQSVIETGNGDDSIIADGGFEALGGRYNYEALGYVSLGNGKDNLKSFGSGQFSGGNGNDTLELTSGTYTIGIWYTAVTFTKGSNIMVASEFEKLIAGSTTYDFTSLTKGQTITVA